MSELQSHFAWAQHVIFYLIPALNFVNESSPAELGQVEQFHGERRH